MAEFDPTYIEFTPSYFFMGAITVIMVLMAYSVGKYAFETLKELLPSHVEAGESW